MLACVVRVFRLPWATGLFSLSQAMTWGKRSVERKRKQNSNRTRTIAGSPPSHPPHIYLKTNLGITHMESLFTGCSKSKVALYIQAKWPIRLELIPVSAAWLGISLPPLRWDVKVHESEVSCPRRPYNVPGQGSSSDCSIQSWPHQQWDCCTCLLISMHWY